MPKRSRPASATARARPTTASSSRKSGAACRSGAGIRQLRRAGKILLNASESAGAAAASGSPDHLSPCQSDQTSPLREENNMSSEPMDSASPAGSESHEWISGVLVIGGALAAMYGLIIGLDAASNQTAPLLE